MITAHRLLQMFKLSAPILIALALLWLAFMPASYPLSAASMKLAISILSFEQQLSGPWASLVLSVVAIVFLAVPFARDYSKLFPKHLHVNAYFDDSGTERALAKLGKRILRQNGIPSDWKSRKAVYFENLNKRLTDLNIPFKLDSHPGAMMSSGDAILKATKSSSAGQQTYTIEDLHGFLEHSIQDEKGLRRSVTTYFQLHHTEGEIIEASILDVYFRWYMIIAPMTEQTLRVPGYPDVEFGKVICLTKIKFFPWTVIGRTIYLSSPPGGEAAFPIGYAVYPHH